MVRYRVVLSLCMYVFVWLDTSILLNKYFKRTLTLVKRVELKCILRGMTQCILRCLSQRVTNTSLTCF